MLFGGGRCNGLCFAMLYRNKLFVGRLISQLRVSLTGDHIYVTKVFVPWLRIRAKVAICVTLQLFFCEQSLYSIHLFSLLRV